MELITVVQYLLIFLATSLIYIYWRLTRNNDYWKKRGVPYEEPIPIIGNLGFLMRKSVSEFCSDIRSKHSDDYVGLYLGTQPALMVQTPELAKRMLVKDHEYFQDRFIYSGHSDPLGTLNLFTVKNPVWSQMRTALSPMFTSSKLKAISVLMNINARHLLTKVQKDLQDGKSIVLKELFSMYTSDTVAFSVFGIRVSSLSGQDSPMWYITSNMVKWTFYRGLEFSFVFMVPALAKLLRLKFFAAAASDFIKKLFLAVVEERKKLEDNVRHNDLVDQLIKIKETTIIPSGADPHYADDLMMAQVAVFILGSVETSASTLCHFFHELAYHPDKQERLYNEINDAVNKSEKDILEYDDLSQLKYLTCCLHETLRKYPLLGYLDRVCNQTYKLDDKLTVEKGIPVLLNIRAIHYDEEIYPEPYKWRPERFLGLNETDNQGFTFLPFGEGPRFCIGKRYGMLQMRAAAAQLLHKYKLEPAAPYDVQPDPYSVILAPKDGGHVKFIPRK